MKLPLMLLIAGSLFASILVAQEAKTSESSLLTALRARAGLADNIADNREAAQKALASLKSVANPSGLPVNADADLGFAALDIAHRLLAAGKSTAAEEFFKAAETSLQQAADRTAENNPNDKVLYLENLARIRGNYLGKPDQAEADIAAAIKLSPKDTKLQFLQQSLANRRSGYAKAIGRDASSGK